MASGRKVTFGLMSAAVAALIGVIGLAGNSPRAKYAAERSTALEQHRATLRQRSEDHARCDDVAFRPRSPTACTMNFGEMMPFDPIISSVAMRVGAQIMGACGPLPRVTA
jgi:hypothetical protein